MEKNNRKFKDFLCHIKRCEEYLIYLQKSISHEIICLQNASKYFSNYSQILQQTNTSLSVLTKTNRNNKKLFEQLNDNDRFLITRSTVLTSVLAQLRTSIVGDYLAGINKLLYDYNNDFKSLQRKVIAHFKLVHREVRFAEKKYATSVTAINSFRCSLQNFEKKKVLPLKRASFDDLSLDEKAKVQKSLKEKQKRVQSPLSEYQLVLAELNKNILRLYELVQNVKTFDLNLKTSALARKKDFQTVLARVHGVLGKEVALFECEDSSKRESSSKNEERAFVDILQDKRIIDYDIPFTQNEISSINSVKTLNKRIWIGLKGEREKSLSKRTVEEDANFLEQQINEATVEIDKEELNKYFRERKESVPEKKEDQRIERPMITMRRSVKKKFG